MAIPRDNLTALDGFDDHINWHGLSGRYNDRFLAWLGSGSFLTAHLAVFGIALFGAFAWSLLTHPTDLTSLNAFKYWGVIAVAHLALTGAYQLVVRMFGWNATATVTEAAPIYRPTEPAPRPAMTARVWASSVESASRMNTSARRWATSSSKRDSTRPESTEAGSWPIQPALLQESEHVDVGEVTWPTSVPRSTALNGSADSTVPPSDKVVSIDHTTSTSAEADRAQSWLEGFVESRSKDKEQRWSWVEAAAASWLSKRDTPAPVEPPDLQQQDIVVPADPEKDADSTTHSI